MAHGYQYMHELVRTHTTNMLIYIQTFAPVQQLRMGSRQIHRYQALDETEWVESIRNGVCHSLAWIPGHGSFPCWPAWARSVLPTARRSMVYAYKPPTGTYGCPFLSAIAKLDAGQFVNHEKGTYGNLSERSYRIPWSLSCSWLVRQETARCCQTAPSSAAVIKLTNNYIEKGGNTNFQHSCTVSQPQDDPSGLPEPQAFVGTCWLMWIQVGGKPETTDTKQWWDDAKWPPIHHITPLILYATNTIKHTPGQA